MLKIFSRRHENPPFSNFLPLVRWTSVGGDPSITLVSFVKKLRLTFLTVMLTKLFSQNKPLNLSYNQRSFGGDRSGISGVIRQSLSKFSISKWTPRLGQLSSRTQRGLWSHFHLWYMVWNLKPEFPPPEAVQSEYYRPPSKKCDFF